MMNLAIKLLLVSSLICLMDATPVQDKERRLQEAKDYVRSAKIDFPDPESLASSKIGAIDDNEVDTSNIPTGTKAYTNHGSLISFVADVSSERRNDVQNGLLYAQVYADNMHDRHTQTEQWYAQFYDVLKNTGWGLGSDTWTRFYTKTASFYIHKVVFEIMGALLGNEAGDAAIVKAVIDSIQMPENDPWWQAFSHYSHSGSNGNFRVSHCKDTKGSLSCQIGCFKFSATASSDKWLWFQYKSSSIKFYQNTMLIVLDDYIWNGIKSDIEGAVLEHSKKYIHKIHLKF